MNEGVGWYKRGVRELVEEGVGRKEAGRVKVIKILEFSKEIFRLIWIRTKSVTFIRHWIKIMQISLAFNLISPQSITLTLIKIPHHERSASLTPSLKLATQLLPHSQIPSRPDSQATNLPRQIIVTSF